MFAIGPRLVGLDQPPLIIAEMGIAHGGSITRAFEFVDAVAETGAHVIKGQTHIPEAEMTRNHPWWDTISRCALSEDEEREIKAYAENKGLIWLSTPFSVEAVERLERLDVPAYKIGSGEVSHRPMIEAIAATGKPVIISSGMHSFEERVRSEHMLLRGGCAVATLHCVSQYPTRYADANLRRMTTGENVAGLSDHTPTIWTAIAAVTLGAQIIEKHVKLSDSDPDAKVAISMAELAELVKASRAVWQAMQPPQNIGSNLAEIARHDYRDDWKRDARPALSKRSA